MKIVFWGTYDVGKPRNRILRRGLRENDVIVTECHYDLWGGVEDKSQVRGLGSKVMFLIKWFLCYPKLIFRFLQIPKQDAIIVGYLGHLDVLILLPFAKIKGTPIVWDAFISLYDTVVKDRRLVSRYNPIALLLFVWEWLACRAADYIVLDTKAHAEFFIEQFGVSESKVGSVFVGAEPEVFPEGPLHKKNRSEETGKITVVFYGQFIPLHGIATIIHAARILQDDPVKWVLIGKGQEDEKIQKILDEQPLRQLTWKSWIQYDDLISYIHKADICLGIFGNSLKASRVIPNKVFQIIASGKPLITRDSPAIRELLVDDMDGVILVQPSSAKALAQAVKEMQEKLYDLPESLYADISDAITPVMIGLQYRLLIERQVVVMKNGENCGE